MCLGVSGTLRRCFLMEEFGFHVAPPPFSFRLNRRLKFAKSRTQYALSFREPEKVL